MVLLEMMLEVVIGVLVMEVDKVADEVTDMEVDKVAGMKIPICLKWFSLCKILIVPIGFFLNKTNKLIIEPQPKEKIVS